MIMQVLTHTCYFLSFWLDVTVRYINKINIKY